MKFPVVGVITDDCDDGRMLRKENRRDHDKEIDATAERLERGKRNENICIGNVIENANRIKKIIIVFERTKSIC